MRTKVEDIGVWLDGLLDAYIAMIPKIDGDATPFGQSLSVFTRLCTVSQALLKFRVRNGDSSGLHTFLSTCSSA